MSVSIINVFNKMTGNTIESKEIFESLLDSYYDKFKVVYGVLKDLPKKYIDTIDCAKFVGGKLCVVISIAKSSNQTKIYNKLLSNIPETDKFDIYIEQNESDIVIAIENISE